MDPETTVISSGVLPLERFAWEMDKSFGETLLIAGRGLARRAMGITPPGNDPGRDGGLTLNDRRRGEAKIAADLSAIFVPVKLKKKRREHWPNVVQIHADRFRSKSRMGSRLTRGQKSAYYVDRIKVKSLYKTLSSHVGKLAAGWVPAAERLGASSPGWVSRHRGRGQIDLQLTGSERFITMTNNTGYTSPEVVSETRRRMGYALQYQANAMQRGMMGMLARKAVEAGLASNIER